MLPILLTGLVITWVSGFDVIYALQDAEFDRQHALHSIPTRFGIRGCHRYQHFTASHYGLCDRPDRIVLRCGTFYWIGAAIFVALLIFQHTIVTPRHLDRIGPTFGLLNGITSVCFATCVIIDLYLRY